MRMAAKVTKLRPAAKERRNPARRGPAERFSRSRRPQGFASIEGRAVILDLDKFLQQEKPLWTELEGLLDRFEAHVTTRPTLADATRLHYLYERASADLGRLATFASEPATRRYLESLVARAHGEIHEQRSAPHRLRFLHWFLVVFPQTFRRQRNFFWFACAITLAGALFGGLALRLDPDSRHATMAFGHDQRTPSERVRDEESGSQSSVAGAHAQFSSYLMTHNTRVSVLTLGLGMTWGVGTLISLFFNGVILGSITVDYVADGQAKFLAGWILPHGSVELPAILIAGQAGLLLGVTLLGRGSRQPLRDRLRTVGPDLMTLIFGVAVLLIWAGLVEGFFSQYHEPLVPYSVKIAFGLVQLALLAVFLGRSGRGGESSGSTAPR
jgi:uncharacterized membrane protein SpoIIM required for sporulation